MSYAHLLPRRAFLTATATWAAAWSSQSLIFADAPKSAAKDYQPSFASEWLDLIQEINANDVDRVGARPTVLSRQMAIPLTAMFDAWSCYDAKALSTLQGGKLRRPEGERTDANKRKAISYAAFRTMLDLFPHEQPALEAYMKKLGYDPADQGVDPSNAAGLGNLIAKETITLRQADGANQSGQTPGGNGKPYADYTGYVPVNPHDKIIDPDRWQPIAFVNPKDPRGPKIIPGYLTPHWHKVTPFSLQSSDQFRPPAPPKVGTDALLKEVQECIDFNANLDCRGKAIVEFMRDGPRSTGQSGHWLKFAQMISRRDRHDLDQDIKLYFAVANAALDCFIAAWEAKRCYDSSRPWTLIHHLFAGKEIRGWGGPDQGAVTMKGEQWHPYSPDTFITPPFPGFVSGHSCVSAGCAKVLEYFTGSDTFGEVEIRTCGVLTETAGEQVNLKLPTFTATAEMAGLSRVMGGYHIQADNIHGLELGRKVAKQVWQRAKNLIDGTV